MVGIKKVAVIGAGNMGSGIAQKTAQEGYDVIMVDIDEKFVEKGMENIKALLGEAVERKIFTPERTQEIMGRIQGTTDYDMIKDADLVIEVIFEDLSVKKELFQKLDKICAPKTILASNTSSLSITELANSTGRGDRFIGLHYFYHPAKNRLVEVIPGEGSSKETQELAWDFSNLTGKTPILVKDSPGFAVNRFFVPWLNEATRLLEEGVANIPTIDEAAKKGFKIGMGPFKLMNVTGVPIAHHSAESLGDKLGDFYRPSDRLKKQFESGDLWDLEGPIDEDKFAQVQERLMGMVFIIAANIVEEGCSSKEDVDRGAKIGLRWLLGPFELMNLKGMDETTRMAKEVAAKYPDLQVPSLLSEQAKKDEPWKFQLVDLDISGERATITINRPEAMNSLNEEVIHQLSLQFNRAESEPSVKAIVLEGAGKAFIAGADIRYFVKKIEQDKVQDIVDFTREGHMLFKRIDDSEKLVIAKLDGLALGGGAELAMAADTIVATPGGLIGFPETGIGIYPGLGGTQRVPRYIGPELAKYMIFTGMTLDAKGAKDVGLVEYLTSPEEAEGLIDRLVEQGKENAITKANPQKAPLPEKLLSIKELFSNDNLEALMKGENLEGDVANKLAKKISFKAPIAIQLSNRLIDEGLKGTLSEGIEKELAHLREIFSTKDAYEGLTSVGKRRPSFKGE